ncbi:hypothetical protein KIW84_055175 [Lathyrus oleraceus]|uniref:Uncharacterized protein n=1 Tax=Pisum sativum TaxID=3888 RepID=A0A9D4WY07_PEA|nr:hypothetical protein KIW84_055175 [Pisum sativum]
MQVLHPEFWVTVTETLAGVSWSKGDGSFSLQDHESSSNMNIEIGSRFDPMCLQLTRTVEYTAAQLGAFNDPTADGNCLGNCSVVAEILRFEFRAAAVRRNAELAWLVELDSGNFVLFYCYRLLLKCCFGNE